MFKRIGVPDCEDLVGLLDQLSGKDTANEFQWLIEQGIIFDSNPWDLYKDSSLDNETKILLDDSKKEIVRYKDPDRQRTVTEYVMHKMREHWGVDGETLNKNRQIINNFVQGASLTFSSELLLRPLSAYYRNTKKIDAYSLFRSEFPQLHQQKAGLEDVIEITVNHLPIPDDSTSWEQIQDFRSDPDTEIKFRRFRVWMNEIVRAKLEPKEIEDKLEYLLDEYRQHMEVHFKKTNTSTLETVLVSLGDRKFGDIVKALFSVKHKHIALLEAEAKAPGREIAFISKARETFR